MSQGELYTVVTNKEAKGQKGTIVAMIKGTQSEKVRAVLEKNEDARNDDMVLYLALCNACLKDAGAMPLAEIMTQHKYLGLPSFESVSRTRRKLQARYPELAGSRPVQKMRATGEKAYRRYAKE